MQIHKIHLFLSKSHANKSTKVLSNFLLDMEQLSSFLQNHIIYNFWYIYFKKLTHIFVATVYLLLRNPVALNSNILP